MIKFISVFTVLIALFLFGCSEQPKEDPKGQAIKSSIETGSIDPNSLLVIRPLNATARSVIILIIKDRSLRRSNIYWKINGNEDRSSRTIRFTSDTLKKGDVVQAVLIDNRNEYMSNEITILNSPPTIRSARILPDLPTLSSRLRVEVSTQDIDDDYVAFKYNWTHNGKTVSEESYFEGDFKRDDMIKVEVTPLDKEGPGKSVRLTSSIFNSIPVISEGTHEFDGNLYTYQVAASDPDGDSLAFTLEEGPEGMTIDPSSGLISWGIDPDNAAGAYEIKVSVKDNHGAKILVPITTVISVTE